MGSCYCDKTGLAMHKSVLWAAVNKWIKVGLCRARQSRCLTENVTQLSTLLRLTFATGVTIDMSVD